jgi:hypothetical protein
MMVMRTHRKIFNECLSQAQLIGHGFSIPFSQDISPPPPPSNSLGEFPLSLHPVKVEKISSDAFRELGPVKR